MKSNLYTCKICGNKENNQVHIALEMMYGMKDKFEYLECGNCKCLQIITMPNNLEYYYSKNYYSFEIQSKKVKKMILKDWLRKKRNISAVTHKGILGNLLCKMAPIHMPKNLGLSLNDVNKKILDVGCGNGNLLKNLSEIGFKNLSGVDLFIDDDIDNREYKIKKGTIFDIKEDFDIIMFHHSFEHMPNPMEVLIKAHDLLSVKKGICVINIPTVSSYAWEKYRTNWYQLDAPRHLFLHSIKSIEILAKYANLTIENIFYDSTENQFICSEMYENGISLKEQEKVKYKYFSEHDIVKYKRLAKEMNEKNKGDQVCVYLRVNN